MSLLKFLVTNWFVGLLFKWLVLLFILGLTVIAAIYSSDQPSKSTKSPTTQQPPSQSQPQSGPSRPKFY